MSTLLRILSFLTGALLRVKLPAPLRLLSLRVFAAIYRLDLTDAQKPVAEYGSISELFVRELRQGARPLADGIVSPVDGFLRNSEVIEGGTLLQVKGIRYTVRELLGVADDTAVQFEGGSAVNLYLSPPDYHYVHAPVSGEIFRRDYIPGSLFPVNDFALHNVRGLFAVNERVVTYIRGESGVVAVVMVGALNVGSITLNFEELTTNRRDFVGRRGDRRHFEQPITTQKGDKLGRFNFGSSVVLLFTPGWGRISAAPRKVRMGERIADIVQSSDG